MPAPRRLQHVNDRFRTMLGDCRKLMEELEAESVHSIVTDPPYELGFMGKRWDKSGVAFDPATWQACLRVAKPGAYLLAFGGTRTFHRMTCAIEDAGWEIRDCMMWVYGSGFPKSLDVSKAIDKAAGAVREIVGEKVTGRANAPRSEGRNYTDCAGGQMTVPITAPSTDAAKQWDGWGTALKPAWEPIIVARKPFKGSVAANVQRHGTGALNVGASKVGERWPANVIHDGAQEVCDLLGSAARFFYCAKTSKKDRGEGNTHPTVKPTDLMRYLCRLVTATDGLVFDPFMGSGSTGKAAILEGFNFVGIEQDRDSYETSLKRLDDASTAI